MDNIMLNNNSINKIDKGIKPRGGLSGKWIRFLVMSRHFLTHVWPFKIYNWSHFVHI